VNEASENEDGPLDDGRLRRRWPLAMRSYAATDRIGSFQSHRQLPFDTKSEEYSQFDGEADSIKAGTNTN
jgi:hypothetical protein